MLLQLAQNNVISNQEFRSLNGWLAELLVANKFAKLSEGGHVNNGVSLKNLFVDLPASESIKSESQKMRIVEAVRSAEFVSAKNLITLSFNNGISTSAEDKGGTHFHRQAGDLSAILLIGGPGQGKSTVGQMLSQICRASLIKSATNLSKSQKEALSEYLNQSDTEVKPVSKSDVAFPIQINLPDFSAWLSKNPKEIGQQVNCLALKYLCQTPSAVEHGLSASTVLTVCRHINVQLVFDGFDEVGSRAERLNLVDECRDLIFVLANASSNVRVLVTTRPQGYTDEFEKIGFPLKKIYLLPLEVTEAMRYAYRLIEAQLHSADERIRARSQVESAVNEPATKRLFVTPLQITIITALVQQMGNVPRERWNLFNGYFDYTYKREVSRETFASTLLRNQRQNIEQMHARVGLILQVRAELRGGASSRMGRPELEMIIDEILEAEEVPTENKRRLIEDIATAAEDRLVFLTQPEPENYGFEVRSLQEFFAAWALTSGMQSDIEARLTRIAGASAFKNVYLFAVSRIFGSMQNYRDAWIAHVCKYYDDPDKDFFAASLKSGSLLALETLEEGVADNQPKYSKILMNLAAGLLELPAGPEHLRLAQAATTDNVQQLKVAIAEALDSQESTIRYSAWVTLLDCINQDKKWAIELADQYSETLKASDISLIIRSGLAALTDWLALRIQKEVDQLRPSLIFSFRASHSSSTWLGQLVDAALSIRNRHWWRGPLDIVEVDPTRPAERPIRIGNKQWDFFAQWIFFERNPNAENLATLCDLLAEEHYSDADELGIRCSWPLTAILKSCSEKAHFTKVSTDLRNGKLGDSQVWLRAQKGWKRPPRLERVLAATDVNEPWTVNNLKKSPPLQAFFHFSTLAATDSSVNLSSSEGVVNTLLNLYQSVRARDLRRDCADLVANVLDKKLFDGRISRQEILELLIDTNRLGYYIFKYADELTDSEFDQLLSRVGPDDYLGPVPMLATVILSKFKNTRLISLATESLLEYLPILDNHVDDDEIKASFNQVIHNLEAAEDADTRGLAFKWRLALSALEQDIRFAPEILEHFDSQSPQNFSAILRLGRVDEVLATELLKRRPDALNDRSFVDSLRELFVRRLSGLGREGVWRSLNLGFSSNNKSDGDGVDVQTPFSALRAIAIENIRGIKQLRYEFSLAEESKGQFIVLIGENGAGKTTILRSIALALRDASDLSIWPAGAFSGSWLSENSNSATNGRIGLAFANGESVETTITPAGQFRQVGSAQNSRRAVFAYGCYRGSASSSAHATAMLSDEGGAGIATLFDADARLINAEGWLIQLEARSLKEQKRKDIYSIVASALCELLGINKIFIQAGTVYVQLVDGDVLPYKCLSDGYLSMSGWFIDVIARWVQFLERTNQTVEKNFLDQAECYILIDEIDAHIHPAWQLDVIFRAKKIFPKCIFVVTTHNPLTLAGASPHEILQLKRNRGTVELLPGGMPPILLTGGQLYKQYFGIEQVIPPSLASILGRRLTLQSKGVLSEDEEIELKNILERLDQIEIEGWRHLQ